MINQIAIGISIGAYLLCSSAANARNRASYSVSLLSVPVANILVEAEASSDTYLVRASGTYGLPGWTKRFSAAAAGKISSGQIRADRYTLQTEAKDDPDIDVRFKDGRAVQVDATPIPPSEGLIPLLAQHRVGVLDPLSALLSMAMTHSVHKLCTSQASVFTGMSRFDVTLRRAEGGARDHYQCEASYLLVAGHRPGDMPIQSIIVSFAKDDSNPIRFPTEAKIGTLLGPLIARSTN